MKSLYWRVVCGVALIIGIGFAVLLYGNNGNKTNPEAIIAPANNSANTSVFKFN